MHLKMAYADEPASLECIHKSDLFPKKTLVCEDESLSVPFPLLCGEAVEYLGRTNEGVIALSNFRLLIRCKDSFINVPLGLVENVESREIFYLHIYCKDATVARCGFSNNDSCQDWFKRICAKVSQPKQLNEVFAFPFFAWCVDRSPGPSEHQPCYQLCLLDKNFSYSFGKEVERLKFDLKARKSWRITYINEGFSVCPTYPEYHIVPSTVSDDDLKSSAGFRALRRFPSVVWRDQRNGAVLVRCSQPELGWLSWRNTQDENLLEAMVHACTQDPGSYQKHSSLTDDTSGSESSSQNGDVGDDADKKMLLMDCRSYVAAVGNRVKGGGVECQEYYSSCEIQFMNLANIHTVRKSFIALRTLCSAVPDQASWLSGLENTKWLTYLGSIIKSACIAVNAIDKEGQPVLVHCSDGWDRTSQIVSLSELMLDPYYRTIEGFQVLVEREWLSFGHKFADRCGNGVYTEDTNERSPIFLQWLDCVFQLHRQFPCAFQFNEAFLIKLVQHAYSELFGTFLCNTTQERQKEELEKHTASVWSLLHPKNKQFHNHLYCPTIEQQVLFPQSHVKSLLLWTSVYLSNNTSATSPEEVACPERQIMETEQNGCNLQKTRSCENLAIQEPISSPSRRKSDPSIALDTFDLNHVSKDAEQNVDTTNIPSTTSNLETVTSEKSLNGTQEDSEILENGIDTSANTEDGQSNGHKSSLVNGEIGNVEDSDSVTKCEDRKNMVNGHICDTEDDAMTKSNNEKYRKEDKLDESNVSDDNSKNCDRILTSASHELLIECSTDTITEDDQQRHDLRPNNKLQNGVNGLQDKMTIGKLKSLESSSSISTSTSDISSSQVHLDTTTESILKLQSLLYQTTPLRLTCRANGCSKMTGATNGSFSPTRLYPTPASSWTPNSTCPPTPGTEYKSTDTPIQQKFSGLGRHLDIDGLTTFVDPAQQRMLQIQAEYERQIQLLQSHLAVANATILQHASACSGAGKCAMDKDSSYSAHEFNGNGDLHSLGSNAASDVSWEQIDENESRLIRWIPDHAVTHCAECEVAFSLIIRKHHCRNCGNVFCSKCTDNFIPIPHQNLMTPERVCNKCCNNLRMLTKNPFENGILDERPLAAAASN